MLSVSYLSAIVEDLLFFPFLTSHRMARKSKRIAQSTDAGGGTKGQQEVAPMTSNVGHKRGHTNQNPNRGRRAKKRVADHVPDVEEGRRETGKERRA